MAFDIEMIKKVYAELPSKIEAARKVLNRPLTLTEKILYSHLHQSVSYQDYTCCCVATFEWNSNYRIFLLIGVTAEVDA